LGSKDLLPGRRLWWGVPVKIVTLHRIEFDGARWGMEANGGTRDPHLLLLGLVMALAKPDLWRMFLNLAKVLFVLSNLALFQFVLAGGTFVIGGGVLLLGGKTGWFGGPGATVTATLGLCS
jgi:hypothetical protein